MSQLENTTRAHTGVEVAELDREGVIVAVNQAWLRFALANGGEPLRTGVGVSYLAACESAPGDAGAGAVAEAIRSAIRGDLPAPITVRIPCHAPAEQRFFDVLISSRVHLGECLGAIVTLSSAAEDVSSSVPGPSRDDSHVSVSIPTSRDAFTVGTAAAGDSERQEAAAAVVAEAVALAMEAVAAEAAEAVLVTAAAVTQAAARAAHAAQSAKDARAFAADAAARSVAADATRTAARVQERAEKTAAQVLQAAAWAADELARSIDEGNALDTDRIAELLAATVRAAADATARDTARAANAVKDADAAAAAQVAQSVAAAEQVIESEVTNTAETQRELATTTAEQVALQTNVRAADVATAAREAAATLVADEQDARAADRLAGPSETEHATSTNAAGRTTEAEILAAADERDSRAEARDRVADEREKDASLRSFLGEQPQASEQFASGLRARRLAAMDRVDAMADRACAAADRAQLTAHPSAGSGVASSGAGARTSQVGAERSHQAQVPLSLVLARVEMLELALRESDDRLRFLVDAVTGYAIITLDPDGIIKFWNTGAVRLEGYTAEEALGRHFSIFYPAEDRDTGLPQRLLDRARADGSCEHTGWRVRNDGSHFWGDVTLSTVHDDAGILTGFVEVVRDRTE